MRRPARIARARSAWRLVWGFAWLGAWILVVPACEDDVVQDQCIGLRCIVECPTPEECVLCPCPFECADGADCTIDCDSTCSVFCEGESRCDVTGIPDMWCRGGSTCALQCSGRGPSQCGTICDDQSACSVACGDDDACNTRCLAGSSCAVDCVGDRCRTRCASGSTCTQRCQEDGEGFCLLCCELGADCDLVCPDGQGPLDCGGGRLACGACDSTVGSAHICLEDFSDATERTFEEERQACHPCGETFD